MIASDLAMALDPLLFARCSGFHPDIWQADLLCSPSPQNILLCSRQAGKSTVTSFLALHQALFYPRSLILLLAPAERQSKELFNDKLKRQYQRLSENVPVVKARQESALEMAFNNGSRICALPGKEATIRGFSSVNLLVVDEASRVPDDLYRAVRPMLAVSQGRLVLLSTPYGKRGFFHEEWSNGGPNWKRVKVTAEQCPRISKEFLESERKALGDRDFRQEYLCSFEETLDSVFSYEAIQAVLDTSVKPLWSES
ncbi:MAG: terminase [Acidobacteria bacterium]|nr:terminase [Acidobacteriota bacterium]